ncbi:hypothetical protein [Vagococcus acidifermentans]|uniref:hypothetical protein n=1 Tax=Vagococcus acidifermentans TaxID=564710 RepID=UPI0014771199|nr:hypothetical protein [Vagococcus acidifermentans]
MNLKNRYLVTDFTIENKTKSKYQIEKILSVYRKIDFCTSSTLNSIVEYFQQIDLDRLKNTLNWIDINQEGDNSCIKNKGFSEIDFDLFLKIMDITLKQLDLYPDKGKIYAEIIKLKYFEKEKYSNEKISEVIDKVHIIV